MKPTHKKIALILSIICGIIFAVLVGAIVGIGWLIGISAVCALIGGLALLELRNAEEYKRPWIGGRW